MKQREARVLRRGPGRAVTLRFFFQVILFIQFRLLLSEFKLELASRLPALELCIVAKN